ncbi:MAG: hypothetical protein M1472_02245 [Planctomycetes bacterium]|jgi:hypothetical protein|nr:hypothetical protein [Planctomycetota bacterium]
MKSQSQNLSGVSKVVEKYLRKHQPRKYKLVVKHAGSKQDGDWWYILVQPDSKKVSLFDYASRLAITEDELSENEHLKVLLVPVIPE